MSGMKNQTRSSKMMSLLFTATMQTARSSPTVQYQTARRKVKLSVPVVGGIAQAATGTAGKIAAASIIGLAVILEIVAAMLDRRDDEDE